MSRSLAHMFRAAPCVHSSTARQLLGTGFLDSRPHSGARVPLQTANQEWPGSGWQQRLGQAPERVRHATSIKAMYTAQADASGNGYLESAEVGRILARMRGGTRGVSASEVRRIMRQVRACSPPKQRTSTA